MESAAPARTQELAAQAVLDAIVEQAPVGIVAFEAPTGRVLISNEEVHRIFAGADLALDAKARDGQWRALRWDGTPYEPANWPIRRSLAWGEAIEGERVRIAHANGFEATIELSSRPVHDEEGNLVAGVVVVRDVTSEERSERVLREFVANAAHQLQSPLTAIISAIDVLQAGAKDGPERDRFLMHVERESSRLARLAQTLMTLARIESGLEPPHREIVPLEPLLFRVAGTTAASASVGVVVTCDPELGVLSNPDVLEHALAGILDNAVKYTAEGQIALRARRVGAQAEICISDTGTGIPDSDREHVFDRFYRATSGPGFGLGLSIVRAAVDALDGRIDLASRPGEGTTIRISLPEAVDVISQ